MTSQTAGGPTSMTLRKRAAQACLACRARKVRCDVTARGPPCMHCRLDHADCIVRGRPSKYRKIRASSPSGHFNFAVEEPFKPPHSSESTISVTGLEEKLPCVNFLPKKDEARIFENSSEPSTEELYGDSPQHQDGRDTHPIGQCYTGDSRFKATDNAEYVEPSVLDERAVEIDYEANKSSTTHVLYSYYPFLGLDTLPFMNPEDVNYLESQGCFRIPVKPFLDDFVREYFLHVHPILPLIDEGLFWDLYTKKTRSSNHQPRISLFVFQSIIFASCCFVSNNAIHGLGFNDALSARDTYYRRAKLLFDFEGDKDPISAAQGALLLSYHPPMPNHNKINSFWVGLAVQHAKYAGAHHYHTDLRLSSDKKNALKRLWWCCILRDRIISLGVRRPLQISSVDFDFNQPSLNNADLEAEIRRSKVYDAPTKHSLIQLSTALCELAVILTEVLMLAYPLHDSIDAAFQTDEKARKSLDRLLPSRCALAAWYRKVSMSFPIIVGRGDTHDSVLLYSNLMYIYYHSAILALSQHEILISAMRPSGQGQPWHRICRSKNNLEEASSSITDILGTLYDLELTKYLPISVVAYAAFPLVLHILDVKLATTQPNRARKQKRLRVYTESMRILQSQYDGTTELTEIIARMIKYVSVERLTLQPQLIATNKDLSAKQFGGNEVAASGSSFSTSLQSLKTVNDWGHVLLRQPNLYLRFAMTIDLALEKGRFPDDCDFPVALQWKNTTTTRFPMYRITVGDTVDMNDSCSDAERPGRRDSCAGITKDMPNSENTTNVNKLTPPFSSSLPADGGFNTHTSAIALEHGNILNDQMELPIDFRSVEPSRSEMSEMDIGYASLWPEEIFVTTA